MKKNKTLKEKFEEIESTSRERCIAGEYDGVCYEINKAEMGIEFFSTQEAKDLRGSEFADGMVKKYQELLAMKKAEQNYYKSLVE